MPLYVLGTDSIQKLPTTTFEAEKIQERGDLQRLLRDEIAILVPGALVLTEEFGDWQDSSRRIDLLVLDKTANLVVVELKRTGDGGHMELQALRYAAMISSMTWSQAVDAHREYLRKRKSDEDPQERMLKFLSWETPDEEKFNQDVRIVLASADFSKELTTAVLWLNEREVDIRCVRMVPYKNGSQTLLDVQQVIPLPEAEEYQIRVREKASQERAARLIPTEAQARFMRFWEGLLERAKAQSSLHQSCRVTKGNWVGANQQGMLFSYVLVGGKGRVELYICRSDKAENKAIFGELQAKRATIEAAFGRSLNWNLNEQSGPSRIDCLVDAGSLEDESTWEALQTAMVETMTRLEAALAPHIEGYRKGEKPNVAGLQ